MNAGSTEVIRTALADLDHGIPWAHHFALGEIETISPARDEKFYRKAVGLNRVIDLVLKTARLLCEAHDIGGLRVLDLASGEGAYSIAFALAGAREVVGVEGRDLYVRRARFVADTLGVPNVRFVRRDVRGLTKVEIGMADITICAGLLHHLGPDETLPFLRSVGNLTRDVLILYTHVSSPEAVEEFRLLGPKTDMHGLTGYWRREHPDDATPEEKEKRVRASLDNTFAFWSTEEALIRALKRSGFSVIFKICEPHVYGRFADRNTRIIMVAKK